MKQGYYFTAITIILGILILLLAVYGPKILSDADKGYCYKYFPQSQLIALGYAAIVASPLFFIKNKKRYYIIIVAISIALLSIFILIFYSSWFKATGTLEVDSAKSNACGKLVRQGCQASTKDFITICYDSNKDGKMDSNDTLFELCKNYYNIDDDTKCKNAVCGMNCH